MHFAVKQRHLFAVQLFTNSYFKDAGFTKFLLLKSIKNAARKINHCEFHEFRLVIAFFPHYTYVFLWTSIYPI